MGHLSSQGKNCDSVQHCTSASLRKSEEIWSKVGNTLEEIVDRSRGVHAWKVSVARREVVDMQITNGINVWKLTVRRHLQMFIASRRQEWDEPI